MAIDGADASGPAVGFPEDGVASGGSSAGDKRVCLSDFILKKIIGIGSFGKVMLVSHKDDESRIFAMKMLRKEYVILRNQVEHTNTERNVLATVTHPFIVSLHYAFQTRKKLYFILEYCNGGELFFHLSRAGRFSEDRTRFYAAEILMATEYLHSLNIIYRDLKPENVLLDADGHVKITDFGLSKEGIADNVSAKSRVGTPEYSAPELLEGRGHGKAVDWYALGALMYEMLTGLPPFYSQDREKLFERIRRGDLQYPPYIQPVAKSLLQGLLTRDPDARLGGGPEGGEDVRAHPYFAGIDWIALQQRRVTPPFKPSVNSGEDVKYFDKEFLNMPAVNSDVPGVVGDVDTDFEGFTYTKDGELAAQVQAEQVAAAAVAQAVPRPDSILPEMQCVKNVWRGQPGEDPRGEKFVQANPSEVEEQAGIRAEKAKKEMERQIEMQQKWKESQMEEAAATAKRKTRKPGMGTESAPPPAPVPSGASRKVLKKKLKEIVLLEERHAKGEALNQDQLNKLATKSQVQADLDAL